MSKAKTKPKPAKAPAKKKPAKPPATIDYGSPERLAAYDSETTAHLNGLRAESQEIGTRYRDAKQITADLKKEHEVSLTRIGDYIDERKKYRGQQPKAVQATILDLAPVKDAKALPQPAAPQVALPASDGKPAWFPEDLWKKVPIEDALKGATAKDLEALRGGKLKGGESFTPINDFGGVNAFSTPYPSNPAFTRTYKDIKGIGDAAAERLADAEMDFWKRWKNGDDVAFAMKMGHVPEGKADADSKPATDGIGIGNPTPGLGAGADGEPSKPGKRKPAGPKLRGGTNGKPIKFKKPKSGSPEERDAKREADAAGEPKPAGDF